MTGPFLDLELRNLEFQVSVLEQELARAMARGRRDAAARGLAVTK